MSRKHIRKEGQSRNPSLVVSVTKRKRTVSPKYQNRKTYLMAIKDYKRFCSLFYKYMCFLRSANMLSVNNSLTASLPRVLCHWRSGLCPQAGHSCSHQAVPTRQGRSTRGRQPWLAAGSSLGGTAPAAGGPGGSPLLTGGPGTSPSATAPGCSRCQQQHPSGLVLLCECFRAAWTLLVLMNRKKNLLKQ